MKTLSVLLALTTLSACGSTDPLDGPGYAVRLTIPEVSNRTFYGDSLYWRVFPRPVPIGAPPSHQVTMDILVLSPPDPIEPPLVLQLHWRSIPDPLPTPGTYSLGFTQTEQVILEAESSIGIWAASEGTVTLAKVTDTSLVGSLDGTLVPVFPPASGLPELTVEATFWAPRAADVPFHH